jgi:AraC-like DNA-binding protein
MAADLGAGEFYGRTSSESIAGTVLSIVAHDVERALPDHTHQLPFLCLLLEGRYEEEAAGAAVRYEPLTLVFHPARLAHRDRVYPGSRMFTVEFTEHWSGVLAQFAPAQRSLYTLSGADPLWLMLRLYEHLRDRTLTELTVQTLCYELAGSFDRMDGAPDSSPQPWLQTLRAELDTRFGEHVDVAALADRTGVHPVHLARAFRKAYKVTVGDYVHRKRIQQACRMLRGTADSIAAIAEDLGYTDQSHFSRVFRSITGTTPAKYRR